MYLWEKESDNALALGNVTDVPFPPLSCCLGWMWYSRSLSTSQVPSCHPLTLCMCVQSINGNTRGQTLSAVLYLKLFIKCSCLPMIFLCCCMYFFVFILTPNLTYSYTRLHLVFFFHWTFLLFLSHSSATHVCTFSFLSHFSSLSLPFSLPHTLPSFHPPSYFCIWSL